MRRGIRVKGVETREEVEWWGIQEKIMDVTNLIENNGRARDDLCLVCTIIAYTKLACVG